MIHINRGQSKVCLGAARGAVMTPPPPPPTHPPVWGEAEVRCMFVRYASERVRYVIALQAW